MIGVNLVGHLEAELGNGETARQILAALDAVGVPVLPISIAATASRQGHLFPSARIPATPFGTTLVCLNAAQMPLVRRRLGESLFRGRRTIGVWWWETSRFPRELASAFDLVDEVWAGSTFVADALRAVAPAHVPVIALPLHCFRERALPSVDRSRLGLPHAFTFLLVFDHNSGLARKNPLGVIAAYREAFAPDAGTALVIKSINGDEHPDDHRRVREAAAGRDDIQVVDGYVSAADRDALIAGCDCFVSLHRAEGFGITLAEAMALGRPVIATGWSGNVDFMPEGTALLVEHRLARVGPGAEPYAAEDRWAEPDLGHAARLMRRLGEHPDEARRLGEAARQHVLSTLSPESVGAALTARLADVGPPTAPLTGPLAEVVARLAAARGRDEPADLEVLELEREALAEERDAAADGSERGGAGTSADGTRPTLRRMPAPALGTPRRLLGRVVRRVARPALAGPGSPVQELRDDLAELRALLIHDSARIDDLALVARNLELIVQERTPDLREQLDRATREREAILVELTEAVEVVRRRVEASEDQVASVAEFVERSRARPDVAGEPFGEIHVDGIRVLGFEGGGAAARDPYEAFEEAFRGPEQRVRELQRPYREVLGDRQPVLDLGCGRGEMLDLLREWGLRGLGVDENEAMVERCRSKGHDDVQVGDGLAYLERREDDSLGAVFAAQVVEHLSFAQIERLLALAVRKLRPNGLLIAETVNPHAPDAMKAFWTDPTHQRPLFPETMLTLARAAGFELGYIFVPQGAGAPEQDLDRAASYALVARVV